MNTKYVTKEESKELYIKIVVERKLYEKIRFIFVLGQNINAI